MTWYRLILTKRLLSLLAWLLLTGLQRTPRAAKTLLPCVLWVFCYQSLPRLHTILMSSMLTKDLTPQLTGSTHSAAMLAMSEEALLQGTSRGPHQLPGETLKLPSTSPNQRKILVRLPQLKQLKTLLARSTPLASSAWITRVILDAVLHLARALILLGRTCVSSPLSSTSIVGDSSTAHMHTSTSIALQ